jgi:hypothetical protein
VHITFSSPGSIVKFCYMSPQRLRWFLLLEKIVVITRKNCKWTRKIMPFTYTWSVFTPIILGTRSSFSGSKGGWNMELDIVSWLIMHEVFLFIYLFLSSHPPLFLPRFVFFPVTPSAIVPRYRAGNFMNTLLYHILSHWIQSVSESAYAKSSLVLSAFQIALLHVFTLSSICFLGCAGSLKSHVTSYCLLAFLTEKYNVFIQSSAYDNISECPCVECWTCNLETSTSFASCV